MPLTVTLLGTGTSAGVPMIGCRCEVCTSTDPRDKRDRCSALVRYEEPSKSGGAPTQRTVLIDTSPDLRHQMLRAQVDRIDGVVYTHNHADHVFGIDDLRRFNAVMETAIDVYAEPPVIEWMRQTFAYIFDSHKNVNSSFVATLITHPMKPGHPTRIGGRDWVPVRLLHGKLPIVGFRVGNFAYCTDCSAIAPEAWPLLRGLDVLVIDALRYRHHPTHMTVDQALDVVDRLKPRRTFFTHIAHEVRHADLEAKLPEHVYLGYDGLTIEVQD
jgi:phosphoribosyl 1,2-cyclic phosphate phosphodiesterase